MFYSTKINLLLSNKAGKDTGQDLPVEKPSVMPSGVPISPTTMIATPMTVL